MDTSFHCVMVPFVRVPIPEPAGKKKLIWVPTASVRFKALPRASGTSKHLHALRKKTLLFQALRTDCQLWKRSQVLRRGLSGSKRLWAIQALPSAWRSTRAFPDAHQHQFPLPDRLSVPLLRSTASFPELKDKHPRSSQQLYRLPSD